MTKRPELAKLITILAEGYRQTITPTTIDAYLLALDDVPLEAIAEAVKRSLKTSKFMPSPAELRELAGVVSHADRSMLAWAVLEKTKMDAYTAMDFDDPIINAAIRQLGGLVKFLDRWTTGESIKWLRKEFCDTYQALSRTGVDGDMCAPLLGLSTGSIRIVDGERKILSPRITRVTTGLPALPGAKPRRPAIAPPAGSGIVDQKKLAAKRVK